MAKIRREKRMFNLNLFHILSTFFKKCTNVFYKKNYLKDNLIKKAFFVFFF